MINEQQYIDSLNRRSFLSRSGLGIGAAALSSLSSTSFAASELLGKPMFPAKAKRVIYMCMSGGPSHVDLFDYKPVSAHGGDFLVGHHIQAQGK